MMFNRGIILAMLLGSMLEGSAWADDIIVDGKSCNTLCQSWLGIKAPSVSPPAAVALRPEPLPRRRPDIETRQQATLPDVADRSAPQVRARVPRPLASRSALPSDVDPDVSASVSEGTMNQSWPIPAGLPVRASQPEAGDPVAKVPPSPSLPNDVVTYRTPAFDNEIDPDQETSAGPSLESRRRPHHVSLRDQAGHALSAIKLPVEPGLKGLPKLSDLVAVRGAIIAETSQEQASNALLRSKMMKATSRSHDVAAPGPNVSSSASGGTGMN